MTLSRQSGDPRPGGIVDCNNCPAISEVPAFYFMGMDLRTCAKRKICPCGFDPVHRRGCIHERSTHNNFLRIEV